MTKKVIFLGLSNYGSEFANTRHNLGGDFVRFLASKEKKVKWEKHKKYKIKKVLKKTKNYDFECFFLILKSFINVSGESFLFFLEENKIESDLVVVFCDHLDLFLKMSFCSDIPKTGHNGLKSLKNISWSESFLTLLIGAGTNKKKLLKDWVLSSFGAKEIDLKEQIFDIFSKNFYSYLSFWFDLSKNSLISDKEKAWQLNDFWWKSAASDFEKTFGFDLFFKLNPNSEQK